MWHRIDDPDNPPPKDGTLILLYRPDAHNWGKVTPGKWDAQPHHKNPKPYWDIWLKIGGNHESRAWPPTHWMPLPPPPAEDTP